MKPKLYICSLSGGKDSTAMLLKLIEKDYPLDMILCCDTGLEFPEMYDHLKDLEKYIDRPITILKSEKDFMYFATQHEFVVKSDNMMRFPKGTVVRGYGYPSKFARWCTKELKNRVIDNYLRELRKEYEIFQYVGIAADEPKRIKSDKHIIYPLVEWGDTEKDCLEYCLDRGFTWGGLYEIFDRVSCWCCPLQGLEDFRKLRKHRPELWERLREMDREIQTSYQPELRFNRASFTDTDKRLQVEDEFEAQGKPTRNKAFFDELKRRGIRYI